RGQGPRPPRPGAAGGVRPPGPGPRDLRPAPRRRADPPGDRPRSRDRAGGGRVDHGHRRRLVPGDGAHARAGARELARRPARDGHSPRAAAVADLLGPRPPPPAPALRAEPAAAARLFLQRDRPRHPGRDHRSRRSMSATVPPTTEPTTEPGVKTFRGESLEELLPRIREELGADAVILRQRDGLKGGVGGFFQKRCVEVDARAGAPRVDTYAGAAEDEDVRSALDDDGPGFAEERDGELAAVEGLNADDDRFMRLAAAAAGLAPAGAPPAGSAAPAAPVTAPAVGGLPPRRAAPAAGARVGSLPARLRPARRGRADSARRPRGRRGPRGARDPRHLRGRRAVRRAAAHGRRRPAAGRRCRARAP